MQADVVMQSTDARKILGQLSAKAMVDAEFKSRLMANPEPILLEHGLQIPKDMKIELFTSFDQVPTNRPPNTLYLVIPGAEEMTQEDLSTAMVAAASCQSTASSACTTPSCLSTSSTASTQSCQ